MQAGCRNAAEHDKGLSREDARRPRRHVPAPPGEWGLETEIPVFSLARAIGQGDRREWLVYAHSPLKTRRGVEIDIPGFGKTKVDVTPGGDFYLVKAKDKTTTPVRP